MKESSIENKQRERVKSEGGMYLKFIPHYFVGMTDRIVLLPGSVISFIEVKRDGKEPTPRQVNIVKRLKKLGFQTYITIGDKELETAITTEIKKSHGRAKKRTT